MNQPYFPPPGEFGPPPGDWQPPSRWPRLLLVGAVAVLLVAGLVLAVVLLVRGDDGTSGQEAPRDASREDFCAAMQEVDLVEGRVPGQQTIQAYADGLTETGTPADISDEARLGFERLVDALQDLDVSGSPESLLMALGSELVSAEFFAFVQYYALTCRP